jgi:AcrR family transcriptional regulator
MRHEARILAVAPCSAPVPETIKKIMDAAIDEFAKFGIEGSRVERIAQQAGFTKQLVYYYFKTKALLYEAVVDTLSGQMVSEILTHEYSSKSALDNITDMLSAIFDQYNSRPYLANLSMDQNIHWCAQINSKNRLRSADGIVERFSSLVAQGIEQGEIRPEIEPKSFFALATSVITGCFFTGQTMSVYVDVDLTSEEGHQRWRQSAIEFILAALRNTDNTPARLPR